jgi:hypothetical protein
MVGLRVVNLSIESIGDVSATKLVPPVARLRSPQKAELLGLSGAHKAHRPVTAGAVADVRHSF